MLGFACATEKAPHQVAFLDYLTLIPPYPVSIFRSGPRREPEQSGGPFWDHLSYWRREESGSSQDLESRRYRREFWRLHWAKPDHWSSTIARATYIEPGVLTST